MGPVKSALEGAVKYLAAEMGKSHIRVNALSPGPLRRAAGGLAEFDELMREAQRKSPFHDTPLIADDVGAAAAFLVSDGARYITGNITFVDCGTHVMG